ARARASAASGPARDSGGGRLGRALPRNAGCGVHHRGRPSRGRGVHRGMSGRLEGKVCLITGAASGIGRASAVLFAREGACVVVADVDRTGADETVRLIRTEGGTANTFISDLTSP